MRVTESNVLALISKYGIELEPSYLHPDTEEEMDEIQEWEAFPCKTGGSWEIAPTLIEVVQLIVNNNEV